MNGARLEPPLASRDRGEKLFGACPSPTQRRTTSAAECGRSPRAGETWRIVFADIGEAVTYCPECAEREFGKDDWLRAGSKIERGGRRWLVPDPLGAVNVVHEPLVRVVVRAIPGCRMLLRRGRHRREPCRLTTIAPIVDDECVRSPVAESLSL